MKNLFLIICCLVVSYCFGQVDNFQGKLTYKVNYNLGNITDEVILSMKRSGTFCDTISIIYKNGNYKKVLNTEKGTISIYKIDENKIYKNNGDRYFYIQDASCSTLNETSTMIIDSSNYLFMGCQCKIVKINSSDGVSKYYYCDSLLKINPLLYAKHNDGGMNLYTRNGHLPVKIITNIVSNIIVTMELVEIDTYEVSEDIFSLPALKKPKKKIRRMYKNTDIEVMELDN